MKLFVDTEFTNLDWTAKLISVAVVDEHENVFYAELSNWYTLDDCSTFVKENVLPHLIAGDALMTYNEACARLATWIEERGVPCIFSTDAPHWDFGLVSPMMEDIWPSNLVYDEVDTVTASKKTINRLFEQTGFTPHFALHDAIINKRATIG